MEPVLFYGVPQGCSFGSIVALEWLGQPYTLCRIEMLEQPWERLYGQINPLYQTPSLLLENGEVINESLAILQHLAARALDTPLGFRQGTREFDQLNQMLAFLTTDFFSAFYPLWVTYEKTDLNEVQREVLRALGYERVAAGCTYLNNLLAEREWLLGATRSLADAYLSGVARWAEYHQLFDMQAEFPHLARQLRKLAADPAVIFATAIEQGQSVTGNGSFRGHVTLDALRPRLQGE